MDDMSKRSPDIVTGGEMGRWFWPRALIPVFIGIFAVIGLWDDFLKELDNPVFLIGAGIALIGLFQFLGFGGPAMKYFQTVWIEGDMIYGKNSFGRKLQPFKATEVVSVAKDPKVRGIYFTLENGRKVYVWSAIDYAGFIYDYIIWKSGARQIYEEDWGKEFVDNPNFWRYEPEEQANAVRNYEEGYKSSIERFIKETKEEMQV